MKTWLKKEACKILISKEQHKKNASKAAKKRRMSKRKYWLKKVNDAPLTQRLIVEEEV